jgi:hypothetical protein
VRWKKADTGAFVHTTTFSDGSMTTSGVYQLSTRTSRSSASVAGPAGQHLGFRLMGVGDTIYLNASAWTGGLGGCWLRFTTQSAGRLAGLDMLGRSGGLPANVVALSYARGTRTSAGDDGRVIGSVDLVSAASMFGSGVLRLFDDTALAAPIEAEFTLVDGEIVSWRMTGQSLVAALDREGLLDRTSKDLRSVLLESEVEVEYDEVGSAEVAVHPPDRAHAMSPGQMQSNQGCPAAREPLRR